MKLILVLCLFSSCNILKQLTDGETDVSNDFYDTNCDNCCNGTSCNNNGQNVLTSLNDVVSFYRLDETGSTDSRQDDYGGNDLTYQAGSLVSLSGATSETGNSIDCGAMSGADYMQLNTASSNLNFGTTTDFTISFWAKMDTSEGSNNSLFELRESTDTLHIWSPSGSGNLFFDVGAQSVTGVNAFATTGVWYHFVFWADRDSELRIYRDGSLLDSHSVASSSENIGASLRELKICGRDSAGFTDRFNGTMDSVGIWNRLLNIDEIQALYNGNNELD